MGGGAVAHYYSSLKDNCNNYSKKLQISKNKNVYHFYTFDKKNSFLNCFWKKTFKLVYECTAMTSFLKENIWIRSTLQWFIFRTKFRIKIILSFGHCFAKINKWGVLIRARGVDKILKINKRPPCIRYPRVVLKVLEFCCLKVLFHAELLVNNTSMQHLFNLVQN